MKYPKYIYAILGVTALSVTSCKDDFLEEKPYSQYSLSGLSASTIEAQLVGLHRTYAELWGYSGDQGFVAAWHIGTDIASAGSTQGVENPFYQYATLNPENAAVRVMWQRCYDFINNANIIIAATGETNKAANAEARFFRAYAYNTLVTLWGDVPLLTESVSVPTFDFTRQPVAEVDKVIDEDLTYAIANLPDVDQSGVYQSRTNKDMARQLAAEAYLRIGMRDNAFYKKAEQAATEIISGGKYKLIEARYGKFLGEGGDYYRDMFRYGNQRRNQGNTEAIWTFEMEYNRNVPNGTIDNPQQRRVWQPSYHNWAEMVNADSLGGRGNGRLRLSNFMKYTVWQGLQGDIRNSNYNIRRTTNYNKPGVSTVIGINAKGFRVAANSPLAVSTRTIRTGDRVIPFEADSLQNWYPYPTKWGGYDPADDFGYALIKDFPVMRLGETYLLRAEARFRQNNLAGAAEDINVLRDRAFKLARAAQSNPNLGRVTAADINIDFILDERARELISEENRRMTLVRTNKLKDRIAKNGDAGPPEKIIAGFQDFNTLLPLPLQDIQLNNKSGESLVQNPGYSK